MASIRRLLAVAFIVSLVELVQKFSLHQQLVVEMSNSLQKNDSIYAWQPQLPSQQQSELSQQQAPLNVTTTTASPSSNSAACSSAAGRGPEGRMGLQALLKVQVTAEDQGHGSQKLLCVVITDSTQHDTVVSAILETYAPHCDGFVATSNETNPELHAFNVFGTATTVEENDWQRTLQVVQFVAQQEHYLKDYAAFAILQSDTFVIPQNLKSMLASELSTTSDDWNIKPQYLGGAVVPSRQHPEIRYCGGGAGYILNTAAIQSILSSTKPECASTATALPADQQLAACLMQSANIQCQKTTDPKDSDSLRFLEFGLDYQANWNKAVQGPIKVKPLWEYHNIAMRAGRSGISPRLIGIHLVNGTQSLFQHDENGPEEIDGKATIATIRNNNNILVANAIRRIHAIVHGQCDDAWNQPVTAMDEQGNTGYVADPTILKQNPLAIQRKKKVCKTPFGQGPEGYLGYQGLQKIHVAPDTATTNKKVLCLIYTQSNRHNRVRAIAETYGQHCDGFLAASNVTDPTIGAVNLLHEGPEAYGNMWLKVRAIWGYVHEHYRNDYDYFHIGGDDHYVIPENLKQMAMEMEQRMPEKPLFMGGSMVDFPKTHLRYCGGGAGYTLNRIALQTLVQDLLPTCHRHFETSQEDRMISNCFRSANILCLDTNDHDGEWRYHQEHADWHASWTKDVPTVWHAGGLETSHGIVSKEGLGQISTSTVSFHLKNAPKANAIKLSKDEGGTDGYIMRRYHVIVHGLCSGGAQ